MSPVRREARPARARGGRTRKVSAAVTPDQAEDCRRAALAAGYRSTSEWIAEVLAREIELLEWSMHGAGDDTTPPEAEERAVAPTWPPPPPRKEP